MKTLELLIFVATIALITSIGAMCALNFDPDCTECSDYMED